MFGFLFNMFIESIAIKPALKDRLQTTVDVGSHKEDRSDNKL